MTAPILWSALQVALNRIEKLEKTITTMKGEITKLKKNVKTNSDSD